MINPSIFRNLFGKLVVSIKNVFVRIDSPVDKRRIDAAVHIDKIDKYEQTSITFVGIPVEKRKELLDSRELDAQKIKLPTSQDAVGANLPAGNKIDSQTRNFLRHCLQEYKKNPSLFLDREHLFFIYKERLELDFSEEDLIFLLQSSLKSGFPYWFWSFLYREKFGNVIPLFNSAFKSENLKVRINAIIGMSKFTESSEDIAKLAMTEDDELILGTIVVTLHKLKAPDLIQRVITNAITRKLIPELDYKEIKGLRVKLGENEKKFLHEVIKSGWANEKVKALNILSITADKSDLPILEELLENESYRQTTFSVLNCIANVGFSNKAKLIEKELEDSRWEELFTQTLTTLVAIKHKDVLPKLFEWVKDTSSFTWRFSFELHEWKLRDKIDDAIKKLCDKNFYEIIIKDILSYPRNEYTHLRIWRQLHLLKSIESPEIIDLIKKESRLNSYPEWQEVFWEVSLKESLQKKDKDKLLDLVKKDNYTLAMLALREVWKIVDQKEALNLQPILESLRTDLNNRLVAVANGDYSKEEKEQAERGLDYFLGENSLFYRNYLRRNKRNLPKDEKSTQFQKLKEDIDKFDRIEDEYIVFVLKEKNDAAAEFLVRQIGRPFESIYRGISIGWPQKKKISSSIIEIINNCQNPLIKLEAIGAAKKSQILGDDRLREKTLEIWKEFKERLKKGQRKNDEWFTNHIVYGASIKTLATIAEVEDLPRIEEAVNRETVMDKNFFYYSYFYSYKSFEKLLSLFDIVTKKEERESVILALDSLDYNWTKEVLRIES